MNVGKATTQLSLLRSRYLPNRSSVSATVAHIHPRYDFRQNDPILLHHARSTCCDIIGTVVFFLDIYQATLVFTRGP